MQLTYPTVAFEVLVTALLLLIAVTRPSRAAGLLRGVERRLDILPTSLGMQLLVVGVFAVALRAAFLPWLGAPVPMVHDEYSLLLQAQTYLEGRLAMPRHDLWQHFQTFHVNASPTFASIYFPGRGLPLVPGLLLGEPWLGVWLSFVLFAMGTLWMLRGWTSPRVAFAGAILVVVRLGAGSFWINSYWGGAFTALGAMLVAGAMPRLVSKPRWSYGLLLGLGTFILMTTRPFEGAIFCAALGAFFLPRLIKAEAPRISGIALRGGIPLLACIAAGTFALVEHNEATTGNPFFTAYERNRETYAEAPAFLVSPPIDSGSRLTMVPAHFPRFYHEEAALYREAHGSIVGVAKGMFLKLYRAWIFYVGPALTIPFLIGLWSSRRDLPIVGTLAAFFAANFITTWNFPHYVAPIFPILLLVVMRGLVALGRWAPSGRSVGYVLSRGAFVAAAAPLLPFASHLAIGWPGIASNSWDLPCCALAQSNARSEVLEQLAQSPGRDLVLMTAGEQTPVHGELVWNEPDIDRAPVVFAHSFDPASDRRLLAYYPDRRVWRFTWLREGYRLESVPR